VIAGSCDDFSTDSPEWRNPPDEQADTSSTMTSTRTDASLIAGQEPAMLAAGCGYAATVCAADPTDVFGGIG
jgi:hypothetical protein